MLTAHHTTCLFYYYCDEDLPSKSLTIDRCIRVVFASLQGPMNTFHAWGTYCDSRATEISEGTEQRLSCFERSLVHGPIDRPVQSPGIVDIPLCIITLGWMASKEARNCLTVNNTPPSHMSQHWFQYQSCISSNITALLTLRTFEGSNLLIVNATFECFYFTL